MKRRVLVTGGTGYIGSHTVVELIQAGFEPIIIDNLSNSNVKVLEGIKNITGVEPMFVNLDLKDEQTLNRFFQKTPNIEAIIDFAASKAVGESVKYPLMYYRNNIVSLLNLLDLAAKYEVNNIVYSSSCTVYGQPDIMPVTEKAPIKEATSPYGATKQMAETILRDAAHANEKLGVTLLRYFNPIGAHPSAEIGELPNGVPNNLLPYVTQTAMGIREKLSIFGNDYDTPDGTCVRDYIYVVDLAKAHVAAVSRMLDKKGKKKVDVFNLGTGKGVSVLEIVNTFKKVTGVDVPYEIVGRREGDIEKIWGDASLANKELNWKADTPLADTLASCWKWEQKLNEAKTD